MWTFASDIDGSTTVVVSDATPVLATSMETDVSPQIVSSATATSELDLFTGIAAIAIIAAATLLFRERTARLRSDG